MKLCNFARFDPAHLARNVRGLGHGGKQDEVIWNEFYGNWELLAEESFRVGADLSRQVGQASPPVAEGVVGRRLPLRKQGSPPVAEGVVGRRLPRNRFRVSAPVPRTMNR